MIFIGNNNRTKIRIGFCTDAISIGGADVALEQVMTGADASLYESFLFCNHGYKKEMIFKEPYSFEVVYLDEKVPEEARSHEQQSGGSSTKPNVQNVWSFLTAIKYSIAFLRQSIKVAKLLKKYRLDVFYFNDIGRESCVVGARLAGIPVIIGVYQIAPISQDPKNKFYNLIVNFLERITFYCLTKAVFVSRTAAKMWCERLNVKERKVEVIHNSVDLSRFSQVKDLMHIKERFGVPPHRKIVGMSARLDPNKGHQYLIEAAETIIRSYPDVIFLLAGNGPIENELKDLVKQRNLQDYVKFLGWVRDSDDLIRIYDISVLPSIGSESFSLSILESMAAGKPVVATNFSGNSEAVTDKVTGLLVPRFDSKALAEALLALLRDEKMAREMGEAGRQKVCRYYTKSLTAEKTFGLCEALLTS